MKKIIIIILLHLTFLILALVFGLFGVRFIGDNPGAITLLRKNVNNNNSNPVKYIGLGIVKIIVSGVFLNIAYPLTLIVLSYELDRNPWLFVCLFFVFVLAMETSFKISTWSLYSEFCNI